MQAVRLEGPVRQAVHGIRWILQGEKRKAQTGYELVMVASQIPQAPPGPGQGAGATGAGYTQYSQPPGASAYGQPKTNGKAIASFVLGLVGVLIIPLVPAIIAVVLGNGARREIRNDPMQTGDGFAITGLVLGWVGIAIIALVALVFLFILVIAGSMLGAMG